jgi:hypothetical protein
MRRPEDSRRALLANRDFAFFIVRPAGRTFLEVKVLYGPDTGNR